MWRVRSLAATLAAYTVLCTLICSHCLGASFPTYCTQDLCVTSDGTSLSATLAGNDNPYTASTFTFNSVTEFTLQDRRTQLHATAADFDLCSTVHQAGYDSFTRPIAGTVHDTGNFTVSLTRCTSSTVAAVQLELHVKHMVTPFTSPSGVEVGNHTLLWDWVVRSAVNNPGRATKVETGAVWRLPTSVSEVIDSNINAAPEGGVDDFGVLQRSEAGDELLGMKVEAYFSLQLSLPQAAQGCTNVTQLGNVTVLGGSSCSSLPATAVAAGFQESVEVDAVLVAVAGPTRAAFTHQWDGAYSASTLPFAAQYTLGPLTQGPYPQHLLLIAAGAALLLLLCCCCGCCCYCCRKAKHKMTSKSDLIAKAKGKYQIITTASGRKIMAGKHVFSKQSAAAGARAINMTASQRALIPLRDLAEMREAASFRVAGAWEPELMDPFTGEEAEEVEEVGHTHVPLFLCRACLLNVWDKCETCATEEGTVEDEGGSCAMITLECRHVYHLHCASRLLQELEDAGLDKRCPIDGTEWRFRLAAHRERHEKITATRREIEQRLREEEEKAAAEAERLRLEEEARNPKKKKKRFGLF